MMVSAQKMKIMAPASCMSWLSSALRNSGPVSGSAITIADDRRARDHIGRAVHPCAVVSNLGERTQIAQQPHSVNVWHWYLGAERTVMRPRRTARDKPRRSRRRRMWRSAACADRQLAILSGRSHSEDVKEI